MHYAVYRKRELIAAGFPTQGQASQAILEALLPLLPKASVPPSPHSFVVFEPEPLRFNSTYWYPPELKEQVREHWKAYYVQGGTLLDYDVQVFGFQEKAVHWVQHCDRCHVFTKVHIPAQAIKPAKYFTSTLAGLGWEVTWEEDDLWYAVKGALCPACVAQGPESKAPLL